MIAVDCFLPGWTRDISGPFARARARARACVYKYTYTYIYLYIYIMFVHIRIKFPESRHQCIRSLTDFIFVRLSITQWLLQLEPTVQRVSLLP